jgi:hypothetical protein
MRRWHTSIVVGIVLAIILSLTASPILVAKKPVPTRTPVPIDKVPPTTPVLSVTDVGPTHISLTWTASTDNGPIVRYWLYKNGAAIIQAGQTTSFTLWFLEPGTTFTFTVQARDGSANWSSLSNAVTVTTPPSNPNDTTPPTTPTNLRVDHYAGEAEFSLFWTQSTDNLDPQSVIEYHIYVNGELSDLMVGSGGRSINYLTAENNTVSVIAVDTAGNESAPATIAVKLSVAN